LITHHYVPGKRGEAHLRRLDIMRSVFEEGAAGIAAELNSYLSA